MRYLVNQALCIEIYHTMIGGFIIDELCYIISCMITIMTPNLAGSDVDDLGAA